MALSDLPDGAFKEMCARLIGEVMTKSSNPVLLQALLDQQAAALTEEMMKAEIPLPGPFVFTLQDDHVLVDFNKERPLHPKR